MLSSRGRISLLAALVVLAACDRSAAPTAPTVTALERASADVGGAVREVQESLYDMSGSFVAVECDDGRQSELVALEGKVFERFTVVADPAGGFHAGYHSMPVGLRGTGVESGEEFRVKEQDQGSFNQTTMGAVGTYRQTIRLVGRASGRSFGLVVKGHYTINANGEVVVERERSVVDCDG